MNIFKDLPLTVKLAIIILSIDSILALIFFPIPVLIMICILASIASFVRIMNYSIFERKETNKRPPKFY